MTPEPLQPSNDSRHDSIPAAGTQQTGPTGSQRPGPHSQAACTAWLWLPSCVVLLLLRSWTTCFAAAAALQMLTAAKAQAPP